MNASQYPAINGFVPCKNGIAEAILGNPMYTFRCNNVSWRRLVSQLTM
jgi:hypothetical protein